MCSCASSPPLAPLPALAAVFKIAKQGDYPAIDLNPARGTEDFSLKSVANPLCVTLRRTPCTTHSAQPHACTPHTPHLVSPPGECFASQPHTTTAAAA